MGNQEEGRGNVVGSKVQQMTCRAGMQQARKDAQRRKAFFMRGPYSEFWLDMREKKYGFPAFNKSVCDYICNQVGTGGRVLDVGAGTGYPHADYLQRAGCEVHGVDIAPLLIEKCNRLYPEIRAIVADAENIPYLSGRFDCAYSISSTRFFSIEKAVSEMVRVTRRGGLVVSDLWNANNGEVRSAYQEALLRASLQKALRKRMRRYAVNIGRLLLKQQMPPPHWDGVVTEVPSHPEGIYRLLGTLGVANYQVAVEAKDGKIEVQDGLGSFEGCPVILLIVTK